MQAIRDLKRSMASKLVDLSTVTDGEMGSDSAGIARDQIRGSSLFLLGTCFPWRSRLSPIWCWFGI